MEEALVSIVLPTYNGSEFIRDSINSVINQTYKNWELIIVNDCSTDNTAEIITEYSKRDHRILSITNEKNLKVSASLNNGFKKANGKYYTWISDDNMFKENAIEVMVNYLNSHKNIDFVSCIFDYINEDKTFNSVFRENRKRSVVQLASACNIGACFMYTKNIAEKVGEYDTGIFCGEDYDYWCRVAIEGNIAYIDDNLYLYRKNSQSLTSTKLALLTDNSIKIRLKYALPILKKYVRDINKIVKTIVGFYYHDNEKQWMNIALNFNFFTALYHYLKYALLIFIQNMVLLKNIISAPENTAFWGASIFLEEYLEKYKIYNKNIVGIIDKNSKRHNEYLWKYKIYSPDKITDLNIKNIIFTVKNNHHEIYKSVKNELAKNDLNIFLQKDFFMDIDLSITD